MKKLLPLPPNTTQNLKGKKTRHFECMQSLPIGCMKFLFPKTVCHHFWLIPPIIIPPLANTPIINWGYLFTILLVSIRTGTWGGGIKMMGCGD